MKIKENLKWIIPSAILVIIAAAVIIVVLCKPKKEVAEAPSEPVASVESEPYPSREKIDVSEYSAVNPDVAGYIRIPDTGLDELVMQSPSGKNRDYYLHKDWKGNNNQNGTVYFCNSFSLTNPAHKIWVLFGHNNGNGTGFPELHNWNPSKVGADKALDYYRQHHIVQLDTVDEGWDWQIFGLFAHAANMTEDGDHFRYYEKFNFETDEEYQEYIDNIRIRSLIVTPVEVTTDDNIALLSTCITDGYNYYGNNYKNWRLVMALKRIPRGVDPEFDASLAVVNPTPLMPDKWHKNTGKEKPAAIPHI